MSVLLFFMALMPMMATAQIDSDAEATEAEKNEDVQSAAQKAAESFFAYMETSYDGVSDTYETVVDGKTFRFVIKVEVSKDFINIMRAAEAVCFVDNGEYQRAILAWLPGEASPIWSRLVPGFLQKYKSHFRRIIYYPAQQEFNNPLNDNVIEVEDCEFYEWVDPED